MEAADHGWPLAAIGNDHIPKSISGRASRRAMDFPIDQREGAEVMDPCRRNLKRTARSFPPHFKKNGNRWLIVVAWANNLAVTHVLYTAILERGSSGSLLLKHATKPEPTLYGQPTHDNACAWPTVLFRTGWRCWHTRSVCESLFHSFDDDVLVHVLIIILCKRCVSSLQDSFIVQHRISRPMQHNLVKDGTDEGCMCQSPFNDHWQHAATGILETPNPSEWTNAHDDDGLSVDSSVEINLAETESAHACGLLSSSIKFQPCPCLLQTQQSVAMMVMSRIPSRQTRSRSQSR